jgi:hypothetical protein
VLLLCRAAATVKPSAGRWIDVRVPSSFQHHVALSRCVHQLDDVPESPDPDLIVARQRWLDARREACPTTSSRGVAFPESCAAAPTRYSHLSRSEQRSSRKRDIVTKE